MFFIFILEKLYLLALIVFVGNALDMLDGAVARAHGKVTAFGGFFDATIDRISDFLTITAFGFGRLVRWEIIVVLVLLSFLISYTKSRGELASGGRISFGIGIIKRPQRLIIIFVSLLLYILTPNININNVNIIEWLFLLLILLSAYTFLQRVFLAYRELRK